VVWGCGEVIATFEPTRALVSVDLPALGRPTKQANPLANPVRDGGLGAVTKGILAYGHGGRRDVR
jgi:hypothetical protein